MPQYTDPATGKTYTYASYQGYGGPGLPYGVGIGAGGGNEHFGGNVQGAGLGSVAAWGLGITPEVDAFTARYGPNQGGGIMAAQQNAGTLPSYPSGGGYSSSYGIRTSAPSQLSPMPTWSDAWARDQEARARKDFKNRFSESRDRAAFSGTLHGPQRAAIEKAEQEGQEDAVRSIWAQNEREKNDFMFKLYAIEAERERNAFNAAQQANSNFWESLGSAADRGKASISGSAGSDRIQGGSAAKNAVFGASGFGDYPGSSASAASLFDEGETPPDLEQMDAAQIRSLMTNYAFMSKWGFSRALLEYYYNEAQKDPFRAEAGR